MSARRKKTRAKISELINNKKLSKKYGNWIRVRWWDRKKGFYKYADNYLNEYDAFNGGWGMLWRMMIADLAPLMRKYNLQDTFFFEQIKEKYGEIRAYHNGAPDEIEDIIDSYSVISRNVCQWCGRPDSAISKGYWVECQCKQCFDKYWKDSEKDYPSYEDQYDTNPEHCRIPDIRKMTRFRKDGNETIEYDIKDIADRYRNKWYNKHKEVPMNGSR